MSRIIVGLVKQPVEAITAKTKGKELGAQFAMQFAAMASLTTAPLAV